MSKQQKRYELVDRGHGAAAHLDAAYEFHPDLNEHGVTVDVAIVYDPDGPGLKLNSYPAAAIVKPTTEKDRAFGAGDARILVDGESWDDMDPETRVALLDHELNHLEIGFDKFGDLKVDCHGRPMLTTRLHDHQFGWFDNVVARHGGASIESMQARRFFNAQGQLYLPGFMAAMDVDAGNAKPEKSKAKRGKKKAEAAAASG